MKKCFLSTLFHLGSVDRIRAPAQIPTEYPHRWPILSIAGCPVWSHLAGVSPHLRSLVASKMMKTASKTPVSTPRVHSGGKKGSVTCRLDQCQIQLKSLLQHSAYPSWRTQEVPISAVTAPLAPSVAVPKDPFTIKTTMGMYAAITALEKKRARNDPRPISSCTV